MHCVNCGKDISRPPARGFMALCAPCQHAFVVRGLSLFDRREKGPRRAPESSPDEPEAQSGIGT
jgi:hypothetical protein